MIIAFVITIHIHMSHSFHEYDEFDKLVCSQPLGLHGSVGKHCSAYVEAICSNNVEVPETFSGAYFAIA